MSDFFNKLKKGIDKGSKIVSAKSSTLIETNKLKSEIATANRVKKETLLELGTKVYTAGKEGTFSMDLVEELITTISEQEVKVADLEAKIQLIQDEEKAKLDEINTATAEDTVEVEVTEVEEVVEEVKED